MRTDAVAVANRLPTAAALAQFAAAAGVRVNGELPDGVSLRNDQETTLVIVDPPVQVDAAEADNMLGQPRRRRSGSVWWIELHAPDASGRALLDQVARFLAAQT
jgi:hypothetical protein